MAQPHQRVLIVGDDNFTLTKCILDNLEQWILKTSAAPPEAEQTDTVVSDESMKQRNTKQEEVPSGMSTSMSGSSSSPSSGQRRWKIEVASCLPENKIPHEYVGNLEKLRSQGICIHFSVNPALLRQYFVNYDPAKFTTEAEKKAADDQGTGPPYDIILFVLPGLQFDGCPRYIERTSDLFKLRLHLYFFALTKSSTVIAKPNGSIMFLWLDQEKSMSLVSSNQLPFPLVDIHKLGPFCKVLRSEPEDFRLNLSWGEYKTQWKPLVHNLEHLHFPAFLEDLKVYCFRNAPYLASPKQDEKQKQNGQTVGNNKDSDDGNFLRIPHTICQWDRAILPHVNELFHFNMRTCSPGEVVLISKLSVKYDPRITGWRNSGHLSRDLYRQGQQSQVSLAQGSRQAVPQQTVTQQPSLVAYPLANSAATGWPQATSYQFQAGNPYLMQPATGQQQAPNALGFLTAGSLNDFDSLIQQPAYETGWSSATAYWAQTQPVQQPVTMIQQPQQQVLKYSVQQPTGNQIYSQSARNLSAQQQHLPTPSPSSHPQLQQSPQATHQHSQQDNRYQKYSQPSLATAEESQPKKHHADNPHPNPLSQPANSDSRRPPRNSHQARQGERQNGSLGGSRPQWKSTQNDQPATGELENRHAPRSARQSNNGGPGSSGDPNHEGYNPQRSRRYRGHSSGRREEPYNRAHTCRGEERPTQGESHTVSRRVPR